MKAIWKHVRFWICAASLPPLWEFSHRMSRLAKDREIDGAFVNGKPIKHAYASVYFLGIGVVFYYELDARGYPSVDRKSFRFGHVELRRKAVV